MLNPIIKAFNSDVENNVIFFLENCDALRFSMVSKDAQKKFTNQFFEQRFIQKFPCFEGFKNKICITVRKDYPKYCWKMMCCASEKTLEIKLPFFIHTAPLLVEAKESQKQFFKSKMQEICGSRYRDPSSPIHKAWEVLEAEKRNMRGNEALRKVEESVSKVMAHHGGQLGLQKLCAIILDRPGLYFSNGTIERWAEGKSDAQLLPFKRELLPCYWALYDGCLLSQLNFPSAIHPSWRPLVEKAGKNPYYQGLQQALFDHKQEIGKLNSNYNKLEEERVNLVFKINKLECQQNLLRDFFPGSLKSEEVKLFLLDNRGATESALNYINLFKSSTSCLSNELNKIPLLKAEIPDLLNLRKCSELIQEARIQQQGGKKLSFELVNEIRSSINSLSKDHIKNIWGELYASCAKGVREPQWSEKHFPEFLPWLNHLVNVAICNTQERFPELIEK